MNSRYSLVAVAIVLAGLVLIGAGLFGTGWVGTGWLGTGFSLAAPVSQPAQTESGATMPASDNNASDSAAPATAEPKHSPPPDSTATITHATTVNEPARHWSGSTLVEFEQQFYEGDLLNLRKLQQATQGERFAEMFHALQSLPAAPAVRAQETALTDKALALAQIQSGAVSLQRMACGSRICAATFFYQQESDWTQLLASLTDQLDLPQGGALFNSYDSVDSQHEQHLVFSIDGHATAGIFMRQTDGEIVGHAH